MIISREQVESLKGRVPEDVWARVSVLYNAFVENMGAYKKEQTAQRLKDWQAADAALNDIVRAVAAEYLPAEERPAEPERIFKDRLAVLGWLKENGYKLAKSKIYQDAKAGKLRLEPDGSVTMGSVERYIDVAGLAQPAEWSGGDYGVAKDRVALERQQKELEKITEQVAALRIAREKEEGRLIPKDRVWQELSSQATLFNSAVRGMVQTVVPQMIKLTSGDMDRIGDVMARFHSEVDRIMNELSQYGDYVAEADA